VFAIFRLRHADQRTVVGVLAVSVALSGGLMITHQRKAFEPKSYLFHIDLNTATHGELQTLSGIGPKLAENIIRYRDDHAPFHNFDEIMNVKGIGIKRHSTMKPYFID
jgi:competence ComEA-like helix-hairpin-helix protein